MTVDCARMGVQSHILRSKKVNHITRNTTQEKSNVKTSFLIAGVIIKRVHTQTIFLFPSLGV